MNGTVKLVSAYIADESATTAIEYALIAAIISIAAIMVLTQIGMNLQVIFEDAARY